MKVLWMVIAAVLAPVAALIENANSLNDLQALADGTSSLVKTAGDSSEESEEEDDFPETLLDDESWENLKCKGANLIKAMHASDADAGKFWNPVLPSAESQWEDFKDLAGWNWNQVVSPAETATNFLENAPSGYGLGLRDALSALGLPNTQSDDPNNGIKIIFVVHGDHDRAELEPYDPRYLPFDEQTYNAGRTYRSTGAFYKFGMETGTGAIFGLDRLAPVKAGEECNPPVTGADLPSLQRYSDVAWLFWAKTASTKNRLKYFITVAITNSETHQAIRRALKNARAEYGPWPGTTFPIDSDEGKVLLGTPNGRAHGYFLAQHKAQLGGNMYISSIQVFHGSTDPPTPNMANSARGTAEAGYEEVGGEAAEEEDEEVWFM